MSWRLALWLAALAALPATADGPPLLRETAADWGLVFRHHNGGSGRYYQVETDGSGLAIFDSDGDGDEDVFFVDGAALPGYEGEEPGSVFFRNDGGRFVDATRRAGFAELGLYGMGAAAGDVDGDGDLDLYLTGFGPNRLFENRGDGSFVDVTERAGVGDASWSASAAFADPDRDGNLDLYVTNYLEYELKDPDGCAASESGIISYCHPAFLPAAADRFYRNLGDGRFAEHSREAGLAVTPGKGLGVVFRDFDNDGWPDLYVANDTTANFLFLNRGDGTFRDESLLSGTAFSDRTEPEAGMGIAVGDVTGNGLFDIFVTNYALETNALYRNLGGGLFADGRHLAGVAEPSIPMLGFGTELVDLDHDGDLDLLIANGHVLDRIEEVRPGLTYAQRNQLLVQTSDGRFVDDRSAGLEVERVSRGLATGDLDGDGDLDVVVTNSNDLAEVYRNTTDDNGFLLLDLIGRGSNSRGIGARATVTVDGRQQLREVVTATSYLSQGALSLHFGVAAADSAQLELAWPGGKRQRFSPLPAGRRIRLYE